MVTSHGTENVGSDEDGVDLRSTGRRSVKVLIEN